MIVEPFGPLKVQILYRLVSMIDFDLICISSDLDKCVSDIVQDLGCLDTFCGLIDIFLGGPLVDSKDFTNRLVTLFTAV